MNRKRLILLVLAISCWHLTTNAQYVPKHKRKTKKTANNTTISKSKLSQFYTIKLKKKHQVTIIKPVVYCDTLIMENESVIRVSPKLASFTLYARYVKIGKNCVISSRGLDPKDKGKVQPYKGRWGTHAIPINLFLNIYSLKNLTINACGGDGEYGKVINGVGGNGGNVNLWYYAPFAVSFRKPSRRSRKRKKPTLFIKNTRGKPYSKTTSPPPSKFLSRTPAVYGQGSRVTRVYNPASKKVMVIEDPGGYDLNNAATTQQARQIQATEETRSKRKDGKLFFKRLSKPIKSPSVKSK